MKKIAILIKKLSLKCDKLANKELQPFGLTYTQFLILKFLFLNKDTVMKQIDLEKHLSMSNPTITGILKNMEKGGLIERADNPEDKRSRRMLLTEKSIQLETVLLQLSDKLETTLTKNLSEQEKEQTILILSKILSSIE